MTGWAVHGGLLGIVATPEAKQVGLRILDFGGSEMDTRSRTNGCC